MALLHSKRWICLSLNTLPGIPTGPLPNYEPLNRETGEFNIVKERSGTDFEAPQFWKGRTGCYTSKLMGIFVRFRVLKECLMAWAVRRCSYIYIYIHTSIYYLCIQLEASSSCSNHERLSDHSSAVIHIPQFNCDCSTYCKQANKQRKANARIKEQNDDDLQCLFLLAVAG